MQIDQLILLAFLIGIPTVAARAQLEDWDSDRDAMPNGWEYHRGLRVDDPTDAWLDPDEDGICNLYEYLLGTDPQDRSQPKFINFTGEQPLEEAIRRAGRGVVLRIPGGHYPLHYQHESLAEPPRLMLQGGWNADFTLRDFCQHPTVLDAAGQGPVLNFLIATGTSSSLILDGFTLQGGSAGAVRYHGYLSKLQLLLANCRLIKNSAHRAGAILYFEDSEAALISDLMVANTVNIANYGTALFVKQSATHTNFKVLHSLVGFNDFAKNDDPPYTSGHGLNIWPATEDTLHLQLVNNIFWNNAGEDVQFKSAASSIIDPDVQGNIYQYLDEAVRSGLFGHPSNRSIDPLLDRANETEVRLGSNSPALQAGQDIGIFSGSSPDIGPEFCQLLPTSLGAQQQPENWSLFPNPTSGEQYLHGSLPTAGNVQTVLYRTTGALIQNYDYGILPAGEVRIRIPTAGLVKGIYLLEVRSNGGRATYLLVRL